MAGEQLGRLVYGMDNDPAMVGDDVGAAEPDGAAAGISQVAGVGAPTDDSWRF